jgi:hypothetical protein
MLRVGGTVEDRGGGGAAGGEVRAIASLAKRVVPRDGGRHI